MSDAVENFLRIRREYAQFCAEQNIIPYPDDARRKTAIPIDKEKEPEVFARWEWFVENLPAARKAMSGEEYGKYMFTRDVCQAIGHWRHKCDCGLVRFVCITCVCMFDADPADRTTLCFHGPDGVYMSGLIDPPRSPTRALLT